MQRLNVICGQRSERLPVLKNELEQQGITNYQFWDGVYLPSIKASINAAHKQIVKYAQLAEFGRVVICEDDIKFTAPGAYKFFLNQIPEDYDLFLGSVFLGEPDNNGVVKDFTGMTLYAVNARYYSKFLSVPDDEHIDRALSAVGGKFVVCNPFVAWQHEGFSTNTGKMETYDQLAQNRTFYKG